MTSLAEMWTTSPRAQGSMLEDGVRHAAGQVRGQQVDVVDADAPHNWEGWLRALFPRHVGSFAPHHVEFWEHVWEIRLEDAPDPLVAIWSRGGGKSTSAELACVALGLRGRRRYAWYVRQTQDRADDSLANIGQLLEGTEVERYYQAHASRKVSKYGHSRGWNSTRLRTAGGLTIDAIGLDTATRGLKIEELRPDLIILDDLDSKHDTARATAKKIDTLTTSVLPAGTDRTAIVAIQNVVIPGGIFARLSDGRADFLATRKVSGPVPALQGLETEVRDDADLGRRRAFVVAGEPTWDGQDRDACQRLMDRIGLRSFLQECQHEVSVREGALWKPDDIDHVDTPPPMKRVVVGVDPSGGTAEIGIIVAGVGHDGRGYVLADSTQPGRLGSLNWGRATVDAYDDHSADRIVAEKNFGGDMVASNIQVAADDRRMPVHLVSASRGKDVRAEPVAALYEDGLVSHVGVFAELEAELTGWVPGDPDSPNRLDALVWAFTELKLAPPDDRRYGVYFPGMDSDDEEAA